MMPTFGATILGCEGLTLTASETAFFGKAQPFGFILFARNIEDPAQVRALTKQLRQAAGHNAPVFVDQEGGRVQRLRSPHWREWLPALDLVKQVCNAAPEGKADAAAARAIWLRYRIIASELTYVGLDGNCAPCLDVATADTHPILRNRCLSRDPAQVASFGLAAAKAHLAGGVLPVIKHIPGHGRGTADSHHDLPVVTAPRARLEQTDFVPFRALNHMPLAMTAHVVYTDIDDSGPATTSPKMIDLIRKDIGFQGLLMTDDLSMNALSGDVASRTRASLAAGVDVILHCNGHLDEMEAVAEAAGQLTQQGQSRAIAALAARRAPEPVDIAASEAELASLLTGQWHV